MKFKDIPSTDLITYWIKLQKKTKTYNVKYKKFLQDYE